MRIVFLSYIQTKEFKDPCQWLERINAYTGVLEALSRFHEVISIEQIDFNGNVNQNNVGYHFLNVPAKGYLLRLHQYVQKLQPDLVLVHGMHFPLQVLHLKYVLPKTVKIIVQNHAEKSFNGLKKYAQMIADNVINAYLFTAQEMGNAWLNKKIIRNPGKIREVMEASSVFSPGDRSLARHQTNITAANAFLWVGRLDKNKDPLTVVKAFLDFAAVRTDARLYMIYQNTELLPDLLHLLKSHKQPPVFLIGKLPHKDLGWWFNAADYIISGSHYEGSGVAVCEAMSCGCIPILTNIDSFRKMTAQGKCGILYEPGNRTSLFNALQEIIQRNKETEKQKVLTHFKHALSFDAIAEQINEVLVSI